MDRKLQTNSHQPTAKQRKNWKKNIPSFFFFFFKVSFTMAQCSSLFLQIWLKTSAKLVFRTQAQLSTVIDRVRQPFIARRAYAVHRLPARAISCAEAVNYTLHKTQNKIMRLLSRLCWVYKVYLKKKKRSSCQSEPVLDHHWMQTFCGLLHTIKMAACIERTGPC